MGKKITAEDCKNILYDLKNTLKDSHISDSDVESIKNLSDGEKFNIAKQLLQELEV